jgi:hypothetical protein
MGFERASGALRNALAGALKPRRSLSSGACGKRMSLGSKGSVMGALSLNDIGLKYGTDKSSATHDYLSFY